MMQIAARDRHDRHLSRLITMVYSSTRGQEHNDGKSRLDWERDGPAHFRPMRVRRGNDGRGSPLRCMHRRAANRAGGSDTSADGAAPGPEAVQGA